MSQSFFTILVSFILLTDPGVNETKSRVDTAKPVIRKCTGAKSSGKKTTDQKLHVFDSSPLMQTIFFN